MATIAAHREPSPAELTTSVRALFLHGPRPSMKGDTAPTSMIAVEAVEAVAATGLRNTRYFSGTTRAGRESRRQVSLIDEGTLARHAARFGPIPLDVVKSQIVLAGDLRLPDLLGREIVFGDGEDAVILQLTIRRDPCEAMELIAPGLREAMQQGEQGALARVLHGGWIRAGDRVQVR